MRPTYADIDLSAIHYNLSQVRKRVGRKPAVMAVVKANAYGHGMVQVARSVLKKGMADYLGVAIVEEGITLRREGLRAPTLVFTPPFHHQIDLFLEHRLEATLCTLDTARRLNAAAASTGRKAVIHVKVDTGMGRIGILPADVVSFLEQIRQLEFIDVKGIYTHFATSDDYNLSFAREQLATFTSLIRQLETLHVRIPFKHCANSGAILQLKDSSFDMVRPGIMMYGYYPSHETRKTVSLKSAMAVRTRIGFLKTIDRGTSVSYGRRFIAAKRTQIATIPVGYADGISRRLTNNAFALVKGKKFRVVGTVCMDQVMIDLGASIRCKVGDSVTLMGKDGSQEISAWDLSDAVGTIPYEICCAISERVPRTYHD